MGQEEKTETANSSSRGEGNGTGAGAGAGAGGKQGAPDSDIPGVSGATTLNLPLRARVLLEGLEVTLVGTGDPSMKPTASVPSYRPIEGNPSCMLWGVDTFYQHFGPNSRGIMALSISTLVVDACDSGAGYKFCASLWGVSALDLLRLHQSGWYSMVASQPSISHVPRDELACPSYPWEYCFLLSTHATAEEGPILLQPDRAYPAGNPHADFFVASGSMNKADGSIHAGVRIGVMSVVANRDTIAEVLKTLVWQEAGNVLPEGYHHVSQAGSAASGSGVQQVPPALESEAKPVEPNPSPPEKWPCSSSVWDHLNILVSSTLCSLAYCSPLKCMCSGKRAHCSFRCGDEY